MTTTQTTAQMVNAERKVISSDFEKDTRFGSLKRPGHKVVYRLSVPQIPFDKDQIFTHLQSGSDKAVPLASLSDGRVVMVMWKKVQKSPPKLTPQMQRAKDFKKKVREMRRAKKDDITREARKAAQEKRRAMMAEIEEDLLATHQIEHPFEHQELIEGLQLDEAQKKKRAENRQAAKLAKEDSAGPGSVESSDESSDDEDDDSDE